MKRQGQRAFAIGLTLIIFCGPWGVPVASGYAFNEIVPDVRQPVNISGGSSCPVRSHIRSVPAARTMRWSTMLNTNPVTIITQDQTANGRLAEIEQVITQSMGAWSGVSGTTLQAVPATVTRTGVQNACGTDGVNSICFDQADLAFTPGVLAFTRAITADRIGVQAGVERLRRKWAKFWTQIFISIPAIRMLPMRRHPRCQRRIRITIWNRC